MEGSLPTKRKPGRPRKSPSQGTTPISSGRSSPIGPLGQPLPDVPLAEVYDPPALRKREEPVYMPPPAPVPGSLEQILTDVNTMYNAEQAKKTSVSTTKWVDPAKVKKDLNEKVASMAERLSLCRLLNGYRKAYWQKYPDYGWVKHYSPDMSWDFLCQTKDEIQLLLNTKSSPGVVAGFIETAATIIEMSAIKMGNPILHGYGRRVNKAVKSGGFDDEIIQLSVEWADMFYATPKTRVVVKMGALAKETVEENFRSSFHTPSDNEPPAPAARTNGL